MPAPRGVLEISRGRTEIQVFDSKGNLLETITSTHSQADRLLVHCVHTQFPRKSLFSLVKSVCFETKSDALKAMISQS
jgi:hypothetical protein